MPTMKTKLITLLAEALALVAQDEPAKVCRCERGGPSPHVHLPLTTTRNEPVSAFFDSEMTGA